jgi:hypothetical protein
MRCGCLLVVVPSMLVVLWTVWYVVGWVATPPPFREAAYALDSSLRPTPTLAAQLVGQPPPAVHLTPTATPRVVFVGTPPR